MNHKSIIVVVAICALQGALALVAWDSLGFPDGYLSEWDRILTWAYPAFAASLGLFCAWLVMSRQGLVALLAMVFSACFWLSYSCGPTLFDHGQGG